MTTMTRLHFSLIAEVFKAERERIGDDAHLFTFRRERHDTLERIEDALIRVMSHSNLRFDLKRYCEAAGRETDAIGEPRRSDETPASR